VRFAPETFRECITPWHLAAFTRQLSGSYLGKGSNDARGRHSKRGKDGVFAVYDKHGKLDKEATAAAAASEALVASALLPRFVEPARSGSLWTDKSLAAADLSLLVTLAPSPALVVKNEWKPVLDIASGFEAQPVSIEGHKTKKATHTLRVALAPFVNSLQPGEDLDLHLAAVALTDPTQVHTPGEPAQTLHLRLASLVDLARIGPLKIRMRPGGDESTANKANKNWVAIPAETGNDATAPIVLQLLHSEALPRLQALLLNAQSLTVKPSSSVLPAAKATCFVGGGELLACVWGDALTPRLSRSLAAQLGAEMIFQGRPASFLGQPKNPDELALLTVRSPGPLFVFESRRGFRSYPVPAPFVAKNRAAAHYLADGNTAIFTDKVHLLPLVDRAH
jgi:hypothetical protein